MGESLIPISMQKVIDDVRTYFREDPKIGQLFENCFLDTYQTTMKRKQDQTTFIITGDIPAMWLRDSSLQVRPYLMLVKKDQDLSDALAGVIRRQFFYINHDPYANAFNESANGQRYHDDHTIMTPLIWERKYELDSLCFPIQLSYLFWKASGRTDHFDSMFKEAVNQILNVFSIEQNHEEKSNYFFERHEGPASDTLQRHGKGSLVNPTGMVWSGFRPSDDACQYGYLIPSNMFAVVVSRYLQEIARKILKDEDIEQRARQLELEIDIGIKGNGIVEVEGYGKVYAYETDGFGNYNLMDDANVPSLLSAPYLGYCEFDDPIYLNTRRFLLSENNPYYYEGIAAKGIGSPHTPNNFIWHIALAIQGMTSLEKKEKEDILSIFRNSDADTGYMHEGFHKDDPSKFTRDWFAWANSMFSEFVLSLTGNTVKESPLFQKMNIHAD